ncbi:hypothetical protein COLO4_10347 [Corchorus olitorius]|uniref:Uncharacterized protein n=1 Tax=Corchorus olitorius TaxID=93759 RepID=A0A1R3K922_9ROSI|nr:hypothetical protein COLO4_10347 [Corchorus olitorius]
MGNEGVWSSNVMDEVPAVEDVSTIFSAELIIEELPQSAAESDGALGGAASKEGAISVDAAGKSGEQVTDEEQVLTMKGGWIVSLDIKAKHSDRVLEAGDWLLASNDLCLFAASRSLVRCTAVCKSWNSLIKSLTFISTHLQKSISYNNSIDTHLLLFGLCTPGSKYCLEHYSLRFNSEDFDKYKQLHFPSNKFRGSRCFRIAGSYNGLVCLVVDSSSLVVDSSYVENFILWNPIIKKAIRLPKPNFTCSSHGDFVMLLEGNRNLVLAFDVSEEVFSEIPFPDCLTNDDTMTLARTQLLEYGQSSIAAMTCDYEDGEMRLWVMKEYGVETSWTKNAHIEDFGFQSGESLDGYHVVNTSMESLVLLDKKAMLAGI